MGHTAAMALSPATPAPITSTLLGGIYRNQSVGNSSTVDVNLIE